MKTETINVAMPHEIAVAFALIYDAGVFNIKNGKATLNFNAEGVLTQIDTNVVAYKRGYPHLKSL